MDRKLLRKLDFALLALVGILLIFGLVMVCSATQSGVHHDPRDPLASLKRQVRWCLMGLGAMGLLLSLDYRALEKYSRLLYVATVIGLALVWVLGLRAGGSQRWLRLGGFSFQPSEFAKIVVIVSLARYLSEREEPEWGSLRELVGPFVYVGLPTLLVLLQPDLGSALVFVGILFGMLAIAGANLRHLAGILATGLLGAVFLVLLAGRGYYPLLKEYQIKRLMVFINPYSDKMGAGWNVIQSMIAVGSGGFFGKGLLAGSQVQLNFLPAHHTDFIFSVVGEELGFIGAFTLLVVYYLLLRRGVRIIAEAKDEFGRLIAAGVVSMLFFHIAINVGMTIGLAPVTGIPLPFISYGGSSLITNMLGIGLLLNVHMRRQKINF